jgi:hypothetical protein
MVLGREYPEDYRPLSSTERAAVVEAAKDSSTVMAVSVLLILFSGVRATTAPHITGDMVTVFDDEIEITLPPGRHQCDIIGPNRKKVKVHGLGGCRSCSLCDDGTFEFTAPRTIFVRDKLTVETISDWFGLYDYMPSYESMRIQIETLGKRAGVDRLKPSVLRHSYGVILASKGFSRREIESIMGFNSYDMNSHEVLSYGRLCEGQNPFLCGGETAQGGRCERVVVEGLCRDHQEE